ncbi:MAG: peptidylprolyl isomerase [Candidatus Saccharimonadales bacterium]
MKKLLNKVRRKSTVDESARITTETIAEHRESILAGGRRFKYPVQYARHRLVINAIVIAVVVVILLIVGLWWQLYSVQNTSDFMYRVTKVIPLPVAKVDGQDVAYSDYLMKYRSSIHYLQEKEQVNLNSDGGKRQSDYVKQQAMEDAIADAYAAKLAKENNVSVSAVELETFLKLQRNSTDGEVSVATYDAVILDYYGWSPAEYRQTMENKLLRQKVAYAIDTQAKNTADAVGKAISGGNVDLVAITAAQNNTTTGSVSYATQGWVPKTNQDGGLAIAAAKLQKGGISSVVKSTTGDGYYFVRLLDINDTQVNYDFIHISLTAFTAQLDKIEKSADGVKKYITIPDTTTTKE